MIASGILGVLGLEPGVVATERDGLAAQVEDGDVPIGGREGADRQYANFTLALARPQCPFVSGPTATGDAWHLETTGSSRPRLLWRVRRERQLTSATGPTAGPRCTATTRPACSLSRPGVRAGRVRAARCRRPRCPSARSRTSSPMISTFRPSSVAADQIGEYLGFLGAFWGFDGPASAQITNDLLGWEPIRPGLLADRPEGGPLLRPERRPLSATKRPASRLVWAARLARFFGQIVLVPWSRIVLVPEPTSFGASNLQRRTDRRDPAKFDSWTVRLHS